MNDPDLIELQVEAWKTTIQVQQHFNDIEMKIRALSITVLTAVLGAGVVAIKDGKALHLGGLTVQLAAVIFVIGLLAWALFYFVDQVWYHRLLLGAVKHGRELEALLSAEIAGFGLTTAIGDASPYQARAFGRPVGKAIHSANKLRIYYGGVAVLLVSAAVTAQVGP